ncbi:MAG: glycosylasparaginase [Bacteroidetes bacterium]|nr:MAG: glycosylasparaginase [Bacteroidota bacterium]
MNSRRKFLFQSLTGALGWLSVPTLFARQAPLFAARKSPKKTRPLVISTWDHGLPANEVAWHTLQSGGTVVDAVEAGVRVPEADPDSMSVGYGGLPDRDGHVTLDASIMGPDGRAGAVCFLEHIKHPISVARKVMEETPHVMLAGEGALQFALAQGFPKEDLLTERARQAWEEWKKTSRYQPVINIENHDTIGMLALDERGDVAGACTTSGLAFKMRGRVGDSPIIGAGLYVDNAVGGAVATGLGEAVMRTLSSFVVVEAMRHGKTPQQACRQAIERIVAWHGGGKPDFQVGLLAVNKAGAWGAYAIHPGFTFALASDAGNELKRADALFA